MAPCITARSWTRTSHAKLRCDKASMNASTNDNAPSTPTRPMKPTWTGTSPCSSRCWSSTLRGFYRFGARTRSSTLTSLLWAGASSKDSGSTSIPSSNSWNNAFPMSAQGSRIAGALTSHVSSGSRLLNGFPVGFGQTSPPNGFRSCSLNAIGGMRWRCSTSSPRWARGFKFRCTRSRIPRFAASSEITF